MAKQWVTRYTDISHTVIGSGYCPRLPPPEYHSNVTAAIQILEVGKTLQVSVARLYRHKGDIDDPLYADKTVRSRLTGLLGHVRANPGLVAWGRLYRARKPTETDRYGWLKAGEKNPHWERPLFRVGEATQVLNKEEFDFLLTVILPRYTKLFGEVCLGSVQE
jgi:hypothetical protein